jgi:DNA adenine methylase
MTACVSRTEEALAAKPFVKWVGGKRQLLAQISKYVPEHYGTYFEPFVGGGALYFHLRPERAILADASARLVRAYLGVRDRVDDVIALLRSYPHEVEFFYRMRAIDVDGESDAGVAAWLIYLNKTGYNGLYRVNARGKFNVPFGRYTNPTICDEDNLRACNKALAGTEIERADFASIAARADRDDFVYFDPPYVPLSQTSSFTSYAAGGFGPNEQRRLRDVALALKRRGVHVLLSNSSAPLVRELYGSDFELHEVTATRSVNSKATHRGPVTELLIR